MTDSLKNLGYAVELSEDNIVVNESIPFLVPGVAAPLDTTQQIYQFNNKPALQDNDLFLISDEATVNHALKNISSSQAKSYFFPSSTNTYTPTFSNLTVGTSASNIISTYLVANSEVGNWAQVTMKINYLCPTGTASMQTTIPFGGNFAGATDAIFVGGSIEVPSNPNQSNALSPFREAKSVAGTNHVTISYRINAAISNVPVILSQSFIYKIY